ncbi:MAG TPA: hypothetical protein VMD53_07095 [Rhizomicrobium sp.]|nr:hypothetical protein [Rhizomicrobium sp.]
MNKELKSGLASKTGAVALAVCFVAASTGNAWAGCAQPRELAALRAAALRQHLMVAALACHEAAYFNRFVTSYQGEFLESDHALMRFFVREGSGEDGYNAYKTHEANESSLRSLHDPRFCAAAESAFYIALHQGLPLAQLATEEAPLLHVGYQSCSRSAEAIDATFVAPARHQDMMETAAVAPAAAPAATPEPQRVADVPPPVAVPAPQEQQVVAADPAQEETADNSYPPPAQYGAAYNTPYAYNPYYSGWYPYAPPQMRQVQGPDGSWYLVPSYVR